MARRTSDAKATFQHEGVDITLNGRGEFEVPTDEDGEVDIFKSLGEAEGSIHNRNMATRAVVDVGLEVLTKEQETVTMRRIHSGTGQWLYAPAETMVKGDAVFVDTPETRELLTEMANLDRRRGHVSQRLHLRSIAPGKAHFYGSEDKGAVIERIHTRLRLDWEARDPKTPHLFMSDEPVGIVEGFEYEGFTCRCGQEQGADVHALVNIDDFNKPHEFQAVSDEEYWCRCGRDIDNKGPYGERFHPMPEEVTSDATE